MEDDAMTKPDGLFDWIDGTAYFRGLPLERHSITLAGPGGIGQVTFDLVALKDAADLLDHHDFARRFLEQDMAPYGVEFWPASRMLADYILQGQPGANRQAIELGCGLGLVSIAAARAGWRVTATDHDPTSLRFARFNAKANNVSIAAFEVLDWRNPLTTRRYDNVFAADVLYQLTDHKPILSCVDTLLTDQGVALIADPNRRIADRFESTARDHGFNVSVISASAPNALGKTVQGRIFRLTARRPK